MRAGLASRDVGRCRHTHQPEARSLSPAQRSPLTGAMRPRRRCASCSPAPRTSSSASRPIWKATRCCAHFADDIAALPGLAWIGYLSTVGVYGDHKGAWVDEDSATLPIHERSLRRLEAERAWLAFGAATGRRVEMFRLSGIYGPGRSVIDNLRAGTARRIVKPGQVFNRIHVDDIAVVLAAAIDKDDGACTSTTSATTSRPRPRTWWPTPPSCWACRCHRRLPWSRPGSAAWRRASGRSASGCAIERIRRDLGVGLIYPTYREGLRALAA